MEAPRDPSARSAAAARDLARTGGKDAPVEIAPYDARWPARFEAERRRLRALLPGVAIEHIGATAVPGLPAKPVIDLMALVEELDSSVAVLVQGGGYGHPEAFNATLERRRWLCRPSASHRTHHLHLVLDPAVLERHLRFRDRLRSSASLAREYAELKGELALRHRGDRETYTAAKAAFVRRVEGEGRGSAERFTL